MAKYLISSLILLVIIVCVTTLNTDEDEAWAWFQEYSDAASIVENRRAKINWAYITNITDYNQQRELEYSEIRKEFTKQVAQNASTFDFNNFQNSTLKREFKRLANKGTAALSDIKFTRINKLAIGLESTYGKAKLCKTGKTELSLEPELTQMLASGRNHDDLLWIWKNWRDATGKVMREDYLEFVELQNEAARLNGYTDTGEYWRDGYSIEGYDFRADLEKLYDQLRPFYKELHTYVKSKLKAYYGADKFPDSGHIPAHLLGDMWALIWVNVEDLVLPYESSKPVNATPAIQKLTIREVFNITDEFFTSLGLETVTQEFWDNSMLEKPKDGRDVICHADALDFSDGKDFRIKQCTRLNMEDFVTVHHEMGHIQYYLQYKDLLYSFRAGANPGFHEAVGDVLALSVSTPKHLKEVGLIDSYEENYGG
ncbi:ACE [Bugula neritina]|uniref:Angiotensin-converting enzyme n=1 Tax=Bugula neritina TaxID=10212 RepID=A0A7J7K778_BUGNE|nr:ACE [Bugula neritina]